MPSSHAQLKTRLAARLGDSAHMFQTGAGSLENIGPSDSTVVA